MTGSAGMLGSSVYPAFVAAGHDVVATDLEPRPFPGLPMGLLDVRDEAAVERAISQIGPDLVVHMAAETNLEKCELDPEHARRTNVIGTENVARAAVAAGATLVYISTAGIFDGAKEDAYTEADTPHPLSVYGATKLEGEDVVRRLAPRHFVVRAGWMVGGLERDHKFVGKVMNQIRDGATEIRAVVDRLGVPTVADEFAHNLLALVETDAYGLYHMTCRGSGSRYDVAEAIVRHLGRPDIRVTPVGSDYFSEAFFAPRPRSEILVNAALERIGLNRMSHWRVALEAYLDRYLETMPDAADPAPPLDRRPDGRPLAAEADGELAG